MSDTSKPIYGGQAEQDQEIARAVDWLISHSQTRQVEIAIMVNEATPESIRAMTDAQLGVLRNLAMIGLFEVVKACPE